MPFIIDYLLKVSIALAVVYVFYQLFLRRLTFYNWNRWYLLGYSLLCFLIPFMNITDFLFRHELQEAKVVQYVPVFENIRVVKQQVSFWNRETVVMAVFIAGAVIMFARLLLQIFFMKRMQAKAALLSTGKVNLYHVNENIVPFSFHNSIFINKSLHTEEELQEIIRHEFVHVKQKHSADILIAEFVFIVLWFNPFSWLMRKAIRQNLEFIADYKVLEDGIDRKQYQYLLLKVMGNTQFSIAPKFNFTSLKNRIVMMNQIKSARVKLLRFLFVLPLIVVVILAFRKADNSLKYAVVVYDAETRQPISGVTVKAIYSDASYVTDANGFVAIPISVDAGNKLHVSYDFMKDGYIKWWGRSFELDFKSQQPRSVIEVISMKKGEANESCNICRVASFESATKGDAVKNVSLEYFKMLVKAKQEPPVITDTVAPDKIATINVTKKDGVRQVEIVLKDGKKEVYDLNDAKQKKEFEEKYGKLNPPPPPPPPAKGVKTSKRSEEINTINVEKTDGKKTVTITLKNGQTEKYDLNDPKQKAEMESKYEAVVVAPPAPPVNSVKEVVVIDHPATTVAEGKVKGQQVSASTVREVVVVEMKPTLNSKGYYVTVADNQGECVVIVKDKNKKIVEAVTLTDWDKQKELYEKKYGNVPPPPPVKRKAYVQGEPLKERVVVVGSPGKIKSNGPLYIIDGAEVIKAEVDKLDPNDIESVSVLKDESAKTSYGEKGKNGVIIITTKKKKASL